MTAIAPTMTLSGLRKAAIIVMALGAEGSTRLFKHLQEAEIEQIVREVAAIGSVPSDMGERVLDEFCQMTSASDYISSGGVEHARRLLDKSLGPDVSRRILDRVVKSFNSSAGFAALEKANPSSCRNSFSASIRRRSR